MLAVSIPAGPPAWIKHSQQEGDKMVKTRKRGVLGISTDNKTKQITSCQGVSLLSGRANMCNQALRAGPLNETGHE